MFWACDEWRAGDGDVGTLERPSCHADDEDTLRCVSVSGAVDCILRGQCDAIIRTKREGDSERYLNSLTANEKISATPSENDARRPLRMIFVSQRPNRIGAAVSFAP